MTPSLIYKENLALSKYFPYFVRSLERDEIASRESRRLERVVAERDRLRELVEMSPAVSSATERHLDRVESFADRLIRENIAKQAEPEITNRWSRVALSALNKARAEDEQIRQGRSFRSNRNAASAAADVPNLGPSNPRTVFGTEALIDHVARSVGYRLIGSPRFRTPWIALPCIEREVRREVMFATKKAGRGHRVPHRRGPYTGIPC